MTKAKIPEPMLSLKGLSKSFGDLLAVDDLSLDVFRGEIFGFLGPNGAGKTTTIKMICGLLRSSKGEIIFNGELLQKHYRKGKKQMGLCPQDLVIWESLTCLEQLRFTAGLYDIDGRTAKHRSLELLEIFSLQDKKSKLAKTLSGGMKRRLNLALALIHDPEMIILDEPQAGLDPQSRILVRDYIRQLALKKTVILTTHDMDEADRLADRIAIIDNGKLLVLDTPENLKQQIGGGDILEIKTVDPLTHHKWEQLISAFPLKGHNLTQDNQCIRVVSKNVVAQLPQILDYIGKKHITVADLSVRKITLEDVFISLTGRRLRE